MSFNMLGVWIRGCLSDPGNELGDDKLRAPVPV
jgi:hypothetical protein